MHEASRLPQRLRRQEVDMHILEVGDFGIHLPREFFCWIYENSLCSYCRESAVRYMGKRRWLSQDVLAEGLYDSNDEVVSYVEKKLRSTCSFEEPM